MSGTFGASLTMSGNAVAARTAFTTCASTAGSWPKVCPPALTFGHDTFTSIAATGVPIRSVVLVDVPDAVIADGEFSFGTPASISEKYKPVDEIDVPEIISWADEERDVTAWLGNELQQDAYNKIYGLYEKVALANDPSLWLDYGHLQESDHFYYMCTKFFSDGEVHKYFNPYDTPYEAFINYMNVLSDFTIRVNDALAVADAAEPSVKEATAAKKAPAVKKATVRKAPAKRKSTVKKQ